MHPILTAAALGLAGAAGAAVGTYAERSLMAHYFDDSDSDQEFGGLRGDLRQVIADDGTVLHAEVDEPDDPARGDVTIVFSHGYSLNLDTWHYQRDALRGHARLVFWDQRSHGRSSTGPRGSHTIDQLGPDLFRVIEALAPTGVVLLVGHSMGGMTVMSLAAEHPELFGERVRGVALIATSAGHLSDVTLRLPPAAARLLQQNTERLAALLEASSAGIDRNRTRTTDLNLLLTKRYSFGPQRVSREHTRFVADLLGSTPIDVVAQFLPAFSRHDKESALDALERARVLVMVGDADALTPEAHSQEIVDHVPGADLIILPGTGHMIISERHAAVNRRLMQLLNEIRP